MIIMLAVAFIVIACSIWSYRLGVSKERQRVLYLSSDALRQGYISGTLRWVYRSIENGSDQLVPAKEFFEDHPEFKNHKAKAAQIKPPAYEIKTRNIC